jgi:glycosyltransferase involved in cell wall biosynthesis
MKRSPHLVIVTPFPPSANGIGRYGAYVSAALARRQVFAHITVLTAVAPNTPPVEQRHGLTIERIWRPDMLDASWKIAVRLQQLHPDLVWFNLGASTWGRSPLANIGGLLSPTFCRRLGLPSVATVHEMVELADLRALAVPGGRLATWGTRLIRRLSTIADVVCVTLRRHAAWLAARQRNVRVVHIPHGVFDTPELLPTANEPEVLMFSSLTPFKGLELLLDVVRQLHGRHPQLRLTVAGAEHMRFPGYAHSVRRLFGTHPAVRWQGYVPEPALRDVFARAAVVVLPYTATTGSSSVVYRAAGWGRPIIASDLPELRAIAAEEGLWLQFFRSGDHAGLMSSLERLLCDGALRAAQARHNYDMVTDHLTLDHTCDAYLRAFDLALAAHSSTWRINVPLEHHLEV